MTESSENNPDFDEVGKNADLAKESFEDAFRKLENISQELEAGKVGLSESLAKYEEGVRYLKHCYSLLDQAEKKVQLLTRVDRDGNPVTTEFDDAATKFSDDRENEQKETKTRKKKNTSGASSGKPRRKKSGRNDGPIDDSNALF